VVDAGVEIGVLADAARQRELDLGLRHQAQLEERALFAAGAQCVRQRCAR
jgi:hypothetical protein